VAASPQARAAHARGGAPNGERSYFGSLDNAVVVDDRGVVNADGLRMKDEFVRHKLLDCYG
jgi:hypothetical protein